MRKAARLIARLFLFGVPSEEEIDSWFEQLGKAAEDGDIDKNETQSLIEDMERMLAPLGERGSAS